jgi:predicted cupin superfamily sugar epimerase
MSGPSSREADELIRVLNMRPHPEGGHFREVFRDTKPGARAHSTAIYFLLRKGETSHWHRIDTAEVWHFYKGAPIELSIAPLRGPAVKHVLGNDILKEQRPQIAVPPNAWQSARSLGAYTLVGCTVAPGFDFSKLEIAAPDFEPG